MKSTRPPTNKASSPESAVRPASAAETYVRGISEDADSAAPASDEGSAAQASAPIPSWSRSPDDPYKSRRQRHNTLSQIIESGVGEQQSAQAEEEAPRERARVSSQRPREGSSVRRPVQPTSRAERAAGGASRKDAPTRAENLAARAERAAGSTPRSTPHKNSAARTFEVASPKEPKAHVTESASVQAGREAVPAATPGPLTGQLRHSARVDQAAQRFEARYGEFRSARADRQVRSLSDGLGPLTMVDLQEAAGKNWIALLVIAASLAILVLLPRSDGGLLMPPTFAALEWARAAQTIFKAGSSDEVVPRAGDDRMVIGKPSISARQIDEVLNSYGSPAAGSGQAFYDMGVKYDIDPAYALAFFIHESSAGTNQAWAGLKPDGSTTHNVGNIICAGYPACFGRFRDYPSWEAGIEDWYRLIRDEYVRGRGFSTVDQILPVYAPPIENDVGAYVNAVQSLVNSWRQAEGGALNGQGTSLFSVAVGDGDRPNGNPLRSARAVMTQGYGVGTHAPAAVWGAIDLAIDGDGDGRADVAGSQGAPIYATHGGKVTCSRNTVPAGNHIWIVNDSYRTGYSHLSAFNDSVCGTVVEPGTPIGAVGSTGQSSGPHLDYQVWVKENGAWVNHDPHEFAPLQ